MTDTIRDAVDVLDQYKTTLEQPHDNSDLRFKFDVPSSLPNGLSFQQVDSMQSSLLHEHARETNFTLKSIQKLDHETYSGYRNFGLIFGQGTGKGCVDGAFATSHVLDNGTRVRGNFLFGDNGIDHLG